MKQPKLLLKYEVTAPSGVTCQFDGARRVRDKDAEIIFIDVHE